MLNHIQSSVLKLAKDADTLAENLPFFQQLDPEGVGSFVNDFLRRKDFSRYYLQEDCKAS